MLLAAFIALCGASSVAQSAPVGRALIYISSREYTHDIMLGQSINSYWFRHGPVVEPIALEALKPLFAATQMCESNDAADIIIWIRPRMSYNLVTTNFQGRIVANVHAGDGTFIGSFRGDAVQGGRLNLSPERRIEAVYRQAMQQVVQGMRKNNDLRTLAEQGLASDKTKMPCSMVSTLPLRR